MHQKGFPMNNTATYTKSRLIKELAFTAGISQVKSRLVLDALRAIISREAATAPFILPGICKFDTAMRKARKMRNPRTGEALLLPAHKVMRLTPSKSLRQAVAPRVSAVKAVVEAPAPVAASAESVQPAEPAVAPVVQESAPAAPPVVPAPASAIPEATPPAPPVAGPAAPAEANDFILPGLVPDEPAAAPAIPKAEPAEPAEPAFTVAPNGDITFHCQRCGQEIEAPGDMAGSDAECPMCGSPIHVPTPAGNTPTGAAAQDVVSAAEAEAIDPEALKNKTIRIDATELGFDAPASAPTPQAASGDASGLISFFCPGCHQEIEATADMAGTASECPNCGTEFEVPFFSEKGTVHAEKEELFDPRKVDEQKHKTMRIDLDDF